MVYAIIFLSPREGKFKPQYIQYTEKGERRTTIRSTDQYTGPMISTSTMAQHARLWVLPVAKLVGQ